MRARKKSNNSSRSNTNNSRNRSGGRGKAYMLPFYSLVLSDPCTSLDPTMPLLGPGLLAMYSIDCPFKISIWQRMLSGFHLA